MTFMVIFYMSYCYTRYTSQLEEVQAVQHSIVDACMLCRVTFSDPDEVRAPSPSVRALRHPAGGMDRVHGCGL